MSGPGLVVIAGVVTAWIAFSGADGLVADDYYKQGLGINRTIARDARAAGWPALTLVAVNDAAPFWERHGFVVDDAPGMAEKLAGYGEGARYMIRRLTA
ncbi:MAG TPA: FixH family protein, partial [Brevundimonas sp.]|nr:FixH family protein [Brevundimonas sp.]